MYGRPFQDQTSRPTETTLQSTLGDKYACFQQILALAGTYSQEWNFSKTSGWMLKVADRKKALFYSIPFSGWFRISLTMRENERELFLADAALRELHEKIAAARKFSEGFALQFEITGEEEYQAFGVPAEIDYRAHGNAAGVICIPPHWVEQKIDAFCHASPAWESVLTY